MYLWHHWEPWNPLPFSWFSFFSLPGAHSESSWDSPPHPHPTRLSSVVPSACISVCLWALSLGVQIQLLPKPNCLRFSLTLASTPNWNALWFFSFIVLLPFGLPLGPSPRPQILSLQFSLIPSFPSQLPGCCPGPRNPNPALLSFVWFLSVLVKLYQITISKPYWSHSFPNYFPTQKPFVCACCLLGKGQTFSSFFKVPINEMFYILSAYFVVMLCLLLQRKRYVVRDHGGVAFHPSHSVLLTRCLLNEWASGWIARLISCLLPAYWTLLSWGCPFPLRWRSLSWTPSQIKINLLHPCLYPAPSVAFWLPRSYFRIARLYCLVKSVWVGF